MILKKQYLPLLLLLATVSCTVLEDRRGCPNFIVLDLDYYSGRSSSLSFDCRSWINDIPNSEDTLEYRMDNHVYDLPFKDRGMAEILCLADFGKNRERITPDGDCIIPVGQQHIPFYGVYIQSLVEDGDVFIKGRTLNKQYCNLKFSLLNVPFSNFTVSVVSDVCGFNSRTLAPVRGEFRYEWKEPEYYYSVCIPRQLDDGNLHIVIHNNLFDSMERDRDIILRLGKYIRDEHFEWSQPDVADINAQIDINEIKTIIQVIQ